MTRVVVVGGGIAGLAAAYELTRRAPHLSVTVVEAAGQLGGKLAASPVGGVMVDEGAEALLSRVPEAVDLATEVGLADELVPVATSAASVLVDGRPLPLPSGTVMGVPTEASAVRDVLPPEAVRRVAAEPDGHWPTLPAGQDVAVGDLVAERLGRTVVDRLVDPLLGGVYAGSANLLSLRATVPALATALGEQPSLVRAAAQMSRPASGGPVFVSLRGGVGSLPVAVADASGADVLLGRPVREITRTPGGFRLTAGPVPDPTYLEADAVVVAAPAQKAAGMLAGLAPHVAAELRGVEYASMALVTLAYRELPLPPGSGLLVPATEGRAVKALTFLSSKWPHLTDRVLVRGSIGRYGDEHVLHRDDGDLARLVAEEVALLTGTAGRPELTRVTRWGGALPQYTLGHLDRVRRIREGVAAVPGLAVCGAAYEGVGVPACIRTGRQAATQVLEHLAAEGQSTHG